MWIGTAGLHNVRSHLPAIIVPADGKIRAAAPSNSHLSIGDMQPDTNERSKWLFFLNSNSNLSTSLALKADFYTWEIFGMWAVFLSPHLRITYVLVMSERTPTPEQETVNRKGSSYSLSLHQNKTNYLPRKPQRLVWPTRSPSLWFQPKPSPDGSLSSARAPSLSWLRGA